MDDGITEFMGITGASEDAARRMLDMCAGEVEQAIQLWFTDEELQRNLSNPAFAASSSAAGAAPSASSASRGPPDVITIDDSSDEDDDKTMDATDDNAEREAQIAAMRAQEQADAEMAARLQDELYGGPARGGAVGAEDVRAPMARTTEMLIAPSDNYRDPDDDVEDGAQVHNAILGQLRHRAEVHDRRTAQSRLRHPANPFSQPIWDDEPLAVPASRAGVPTSGQSSRATRLSELFRPPYDLMLHADWDQARDLGKEQMKWILVNLQNMSDFNCQALNRDIWRDEAIKEIVSENFLFLQYDKDDPRAERYVGFYFPNQSHENPDNYPHVGIIDPRTGEQVKVFSGTPFPNALEFHAMLAEFLDRYSLDLNSKNPVARAKQPARAVDVNRMTEEEMLRMAMDNSLQTANGGAAPNQPTFHDPDALTKEDTASDDVSGKGKEKEAELAESQASTTGGINTSSVFGGISETKPHVEPKNDPATTTRIQFRHPNGRIIRRFSLDDAIVRIYEWLKAEPLEGQEGREFELKTMPAGHDLIEDLEKTISEAGLKQATVMIEYL